MKCENCSIKLKDDYHSVGSFSYCDECFYELFTICENCERIIDNDEILNCCDSDFYFCENCISSVYTCDDCGQYYRYGVNIHQDQDRTICNDCYDDRYFTCYNCEYIYREDEAYCCDNCGECFCLDCWNEHEHNHEIENKSYRGYRIGKKQNKYIKISRLVGVEIEVEEGDHYVLSELPEGVGRESDGSLSNGIEIITQPASLDGLSDLIKDVCDILKRGNFKIEGSCGLHVHLDASDFRQDRAKIIKVYNTFLASERYLYAMLPKTRRSNTYCKPSDASYKEIPDHYTIEEIEQYWYKTDHQGTINANKSSKYDSSRYNAINLHSLFYRGTLEIRHHSGTRNPDKILRWCGLLLKIIYYALNKYKKNDLINLRRAKTFYSFFKIFNIEKHQQKYILSRVKHFNNFDLINNNK